MPQLSTATFTINAPSVIHQTLDGEVIVVNLDTGVYYSLAGTAAEIWTALEAGASAARTARGLAQRYSAAGSELEDAVAAFVGELEQEELIVAGAAAGAEETGVDAAANGVAHPSFVAPVLQKYTDMQELLLLDPIHEVDEAGWPHPLAGGAGSS
jgi:hypothetical protein